MCVTNKLKTDQLAMTDVRPIILCGGSGSRLWPLSRPGFPKQFLSLTEKESMFQLSGRRLLTALEVDHVRAALPIIVCNENHRFIAAEQMSEIGIEVGALVLEPEGRNTAPALSLAALAAVEDGTDPVLVVTPADQSIGDQSAFSVAIHKAIGEAEKGAIVVLGVKPTRPETGYGYIKVQNEMNSCDFSTVEHFVEKPNEVTAERLIEKGGYFWNAGVFVLKASVWLGALRKFCPELNDLVTLAWQIRTKDGIYIRPNNNIFKKITSESIDYAVVERCTGEVPLSMIQLDAGWSDLGSWGAVWETMEKDQSQNVIVGRAVALNSSNALAYSSGRQIGIVGLNNVAVIETSDAVLVIDKNKAQDVRGFIKHLEEYEQKHNSTNRLTKSHRKERRPWGWFDSLDEGERFKVKRIFVNPGGSLSLQKHEHRSEHWIVIKGVAKVTCGDVVKTLVENQSTYIPKGSLHRIENVSDKPLEIIEVQTGDYIDESDIHRVEDCYGRIADI